MSNLEFIRRALEEDIAFWKAEKEKRPDDRFIIGTIAGLEAFKAKVKTNLNKEE